MHITILSNVYFVYVDPHEQMQPLSLSLSEILVMIFLLQQLQMLLWQYRVQFTFSWWMEILNKLHVDV